MGINTTSFSVRSGITKGKGLAPLSADLYDGANYPSFGAGDEVLISSPEIEEAPTMLDDEGVNGTQYSSGQDVSALPVQVSGTVALRTIDAGRMLFHALGYESLEGPLVSGDKYAHLFLIDPSGKDQRLYNDAEKLLDPTIGATDVRNAYFNMLRADGPADRIAHNATIKEFTLSSEGGAPLNLEFSGTAQNAIKDATKAGSLAMTLPALIQLMKRYKWSDQTTLKSYIGKWNEAGTAVTEGVECLTNLSISNSFGQAEGVQTSCSGLAQAEPVADGMGELTVELSRYKYDTLDWMETLKSGQEIAFRTGFKIGDYTLQIFVPRIKLNSASGVVGEGGRINLVGKALKPENSVDPFATQRTIGGTTFALPFASPMYVILVDDTDTNYMRVS